MFLSILQSKGFGMDQGDPTVSCPSSSPKDSNKLEDGMNSWTLTHNSAPPNNCWCLLEALYNKHPESSFLLSPIKETHLDIPKTRNITWSSRATTTPGYRRGWHRFFSFSFPSDAPRSSCLDCIVGLEGINSKPITIKITQKQRQLRF